MNKRHWVFLGLLLVLVLAVSACGGDDKPKEEDNGSSSAAPSTYVTLDVKTAFEQLETQSDAVIVDVRNPDEWALTGVPPNASLIPLPEFEARAPGELPKDKPIYVICNSGNRSRVASEALIRLGYEQVYNIDGGIQAWLQADLPVERYES